ncbi:MAG: class E sortase [Actinomycetota bacterium]
MRRNPVVVALGLAALLSACGRSVDVDVAAPRAADEAIAALSDAPAVVQEAVVEQPVVVGTLSQRLRDGAVVARTGSAGQLGVATAQAIRDGIVAALPVPAPAPTQAYFDEELVDLGRIVIPALGIDQTLHQGISLYNIDRGPSHWPGTAAPGGFGNVVIAGHRTTHGAPFRDIDRLAPGDQVIFETDGEVHVYVVAGDEVVTPRGLHIVDQTPGHTATLFACHPPGSAEYRYVVHLDLDPDATVDLEPAAA